MTELERPEDLTGQLAQNAAVIRADADLAAASYYAATVPVDEALLAPMGRMTWAAIRLHHAIRDTLGRYFTGALSNAPFDKTLGGVITDLEKAALNIGEPWAGSVSVWIATYGRPAQSLRDRITHAVAYTAPDGRQALRTSLHARHGGHERVTEALLIEATGLLVLASVRLDQVCVACRGQ